MSGQERTEEATPRRRARARAQGLSVRSTLAGPALALALAVAPALGFVHHLAGWEQGFRAAAGAALASAHEPNASSLWMITRLMLTQSWVWQIVSMSWLAACCAAVAGSMVCGSLSFAPGVLVPRLQRASWLAGVRRIATVDNIFQAGGAAVSVALIVSVTSPILLHLIILLSGARDVFTQASAAMQAGTSLWWRASAVLLIVASLDIAVQRQRHAARLRMTPREVRDERAETEVKPEAKQRRRAIGARRARGLRIAALRRATAVIANPTHLAVALRYAPPELDVPTVVARGANLMADVVRAAAQRFGVPIVESRELAHKLYALVDVDEPIPEECYAAVAAVFAWIIRTRGALRRGDESVQ